MSKKFDIITIVLMLVLIIVLFFVVFNYYTHPSSTVTTNSPFVEINTDSEIQSLSGSNTILKNNVVIEYASGEDGKSEGFIDMNSGDIIGSGDGVIDSVYTEDHTVIETDKNSTPEASSSDANTTDQPLIITSNDNISDKEKKEVLKELDDTLMELLDVIDSVQTIDESRLEIDESEVQQ